MRAHDARAVRYHLCSYRVKGEREPSQGPVRRPFVLLPHGGVHHVVLILMLSLVRPQHTRDVAVSKISGAQDASVSVNKYITDFIS